MLTARERAMVLDAVEEQLGIEPTVETRNRKPMRNRTVRHIEARDASAPLNEYLPLPGEDPLIITRDGRPVAALVPIENADLETLSLSTDPQFLALIERSRARHRAEGGISPAEMRRRLDVKP